MNALSTKYDLYVSFAVAHKIDCFLLLCIRVAETSTRKTSLLLYFLCFEHVLRLGEFGFAMVREREH